MAGIFVEHARGVLLDDVSVSFLGRPKPGNVWGECVSVDANSTSGVVSRDVKCTRQD